MAPSQAILLLRGPARPRICLLVRPVVVSPAQRHGISTGWLTKTEDARVAWAARAKEVAAGKQPNFWDMLEERGFVKDTAGWVAQRAGGGQ